MPAQAGIHKRRYSTGLPSVVMGSRLHGNDREVNSSEMGRRKPLQGLDRVVAMRLAMTTVRLPRLCEPRSGEAIQRSRKNEKGG
jgi:hypothetical protein